MAAKKEIFFCYAREDEDLRIKLEKQLNILQLLGFIDIWNDREISAGTPWEQEIDTHLNTAHIILLLVSPDFMVSKYCYGKEMKRAMERHQAGEALVIPIILRPVLWKRAPFGKLQALPTDGKPVTDSKYWSTPDAAFYDVAEGIRKAVEEKTLKPPVNAFDVFLSYSAVDAIWVENLVKRLEIEHGLHIWPNKWQTIPDQPSQQATAQVINHTGCCVICIGEQTPVDLLKQEIEKALDRQSKDPSFRIIPLLLPGTKDLKVDDFVSRRVCVDFRNADQAYAFHLLVCGVKGVPPGPWPPRQTDIHKDK